MDYLYLSLLIKKQWHFWLTTVHLSCGFIREGSERNVEININFFSLWLVSVLDFASGRSFGTLDQVLYYGTDSSIWLLIGIQPYCIKLIATSFLWSLSFCPLEVT